MLEHGSIGKWSLLLITMVSASVPLSAPVRAADQPVWERGDGYRAIPLRVPASGRNGFALLPVELTGIRFTNTLPDTRAMTNQNLLNGSGLALGDYDGDGRCDIYLCDLGGTNALYRNLGNWRFQDVTREAGVSCPNQASTGAVFADINGDGSLDLLVTSLGGPNACFLNDGHGHFSNVTAAAGLISRLGSTSMALADVDGDGTLDLYVANYGATSILRSGGVLNVSTGPDGKPVVRGRYAQRIKIIDGTMYELGEPDALYLNDGKGNFKAVSWTDGTFLDENGKPLAAAPWDQGLAVLFRDINQDRFPDIYVCNDAFTPDRCWINDGHGRFRALSTLALRQTSYFSMGGDFGDLDRDGHDDLLVVDMQSRQHQLLLTQKGNVHPQPRIPGQFDTQFQIRRNTLLHARGDGTFEEIANYAGVAGSEWSWSCVFLDVDLDGWEDILIGNGFHHDVDDIDTKERIDKMGKLSMQESRQTMLLFPLLDTPNVAFHNQHDLTFREVGAEWGFNSKQVSNGMALADLDNDGDLDVVVNCLNAPVLVYRNDSTASRVALRLRGLPPNTQGIGARITVVGGPVEQSQEVICGGRYMSGDDPIRVFAAGTASNLTIEVSWRSGRRSVVPNARPNQLYEIAEPNATEVQSSKPKTQNIPSVTQHASRTTVQELPGTNVPPLFEDVSALLGHQHHEELFDDFARQPLLPSRLSQLGPGVAWFDLNGDGREELIVASGKGGQLAIFRNDPQEGLVPYVSDGGTAAATRDLTAVVGWMPAPGKPELLVGASNYEEGSTNEASILRFGFAANGLKPLPGLPPAPASVGALALTDIDGDGDLDLFVGGRVTPGRYPEPASSRLFRNTGGELQLDSENSQALTNVGLVTGACFTDLNADGWPDLVLAIEWGPVRIFKNEGGKLVSWNAPVTLKSSSRRSPPQSTTINQLTGWWTGVACGDLDGDGRMDVVAGNWGLNSPCVATDEHPVRLYYGELISPGQVDVFEALDDPELGTVPRRDMGAVAKVWPAIRGKFPTQAAYAKARVSEVLGEKMSQAKEVQAKTLASMVFFNRGERFEAALLPPEAQFTPVFGVNIADMDGDGHDDVFLSQNFFGTQEEMPRLDAGRGLWLRGDGRGKLTPLSGQETGVKVYGEQRGAALCDYDGDGRVDLVVTQNGAETKLYRNTKARPGLRLKLEGPAGNPAGIGTQARLIYGERAGPVREVHAGSGYWSQDSAVVVLGTPEPPTQIQVRWPGGKVIAYGVPAGSREVQLSPGGEIVVLR